MRETTPVPRPVRRALTDLGDQFTTWRRLRGLTAAQVADRAGLSRGTLHRLEHGDGASLENTLRVARALGVLELLVTAIDPYGTDVGRLRSLESLPQRVRPSASGSGTGDART